MGPVRICSPPAGRGAGMGKLCPTHQQPYREGICPLCEQRAGGAVDYEAECRRLNARLALAERLAEAVTEAFEHYLIRAENHHPVAKRLGDLCRKWEAGR